MRIDMTEMEAVEGEGRREAEGECDMTGRQEAFRSIRDHVSSTIRIPFMRRMSNFT